MKKVVANSQTLEQVRKVMSENFGNGNFKIWWSDDVLFICIKEMADNTKFFVAKSMFDICMPEVNFDVQMISPQSDLWKR